jgi:hypothetical protein
MISRRTFIKQTAALGATAAAPGAYPGSAGAWDARREVNRNPRAITMWDFSWLERRWPGAGYEDCDAAMDQAGERGYDAIRIDAFPHLVATAPEKDWMLLPVWSVQDWGSPALNRVRVLPALHEFVAGCRRRKIKVGLSTWYREDADQTRMKITSPEIMAEQWNITLAGLKRAGLLDSILYVDLCNEWPGELWCPFFHNDPPGLTWGGWHTETSMRWMKQACESVRREHSGLPISFSFEPKDRTKLAGKNLRFLDFADPHLWLAQANGSEFYNQIGYKGSLFDLGGYHTLADKAESAYRARVGYWRGLLREHILSCANAFKPHGLPLITTECWAVVDYKDWPLLNWDWVKVLCRRCVETAAATGQWLAIGTSNFAGPQFHGMWRDVRWHRELTDLIKRSPILPELQKATLATRL